MTKGSTPKGRVAVAKPLMSGLPEIPQQALSRLIDRVFGDSRRVSLTPMPGGASTRRFLRITPERGVGAVAIFVPEASHSDELTKGTTTGRWPFLEIRDLLETHGVPVPKLLGEACDDGLILVEDLGDDTLAAVLEQTPEAKAELYQNAVRSLALAQRNLATLPQDSVVRSRCFDEELLRWEIDHFREWGLEARNISLSREERRVFDAARDYLARVIAEWPRGFVHRDYQSRNLMVRCGDGTHRELVWIDFQDALLGPRIYDLVALLNDSYQQFTREFIEARLTDYAEALELADSEQARLLYEFDLVTVQRKLKDAGRFVFIDQVKHNPSFLPFVEPTLAKVLDSLDRLPSEPLLVTLKELLTEHRSGA